MLPIAQKLDAVGFWSLEVWGGATFDTCLRFLKEDPWERLRALRAAMPNTKLQMLLRGQNLVGYRHYADDVLERFVERSAANGIDVFRIFDALNDVRNVDRAVREVKACGKHAEAALSYTVSPVHNIDRYVDLARQLEDLGTDTLCIKDMAGLLAPLDAYHLVRRLKAAVKVPIHLHSHYTSGMASMSALMAILGGLDMLDTAMSPLAGGTSHPATESMVASLQGTPYDTGLALESFLPITEHFRTVRRRRGDTAQMRFGGADLLVHRLLERVRRVLDSGLQLLQLVELHFARNVRLHVVHVALHAAEQVAERTRDFRQALRADDDERHDRDNENLGESDVEHKGSGESGEGA
jgi:pyruvate carboxylase subunit B